MRHDVYDVLVVVHAIVAVVGFGAIALSGVYGHTARRRSRPGALEEVRRYFARPPLAEGAVVAVGLLGIAALAVDPHGEGFDQVWIGVGLVAWLAASALWVGLVRPAEAAIRTGVGQLEPSGASVDGASQALDVAGLRLSRAATATSILFLIALGFMITQPG